MSEQKKPKSSFNLPDFNEVGAMAGKLFKDIKKSVSEIVQDYKTKQASKKTAAENAADDVDKKPTVAKSAKTKETKTESNAEQKTEPKPKQTQTTKQSEQKAKADEETKS